MHSKIKFFISILLSLAMVVGVATVVSAAEPRYSDTNMVTIRFTFIGTTAYCDVSVIGATGTSSISDGELVIKNSKGEVAGEWTGFSSNNNELYISKNVSNLTKGETYYATFSANVTRNGKIEPVSGSKSNTCPKK